MQTILNKDIQYYINANLHADLHSLLLKKSPFDGISMHEIVQQIKGKKVAEKKFPFLKKEGIIFPPNLNLEQASSQSTAVYKAQLLQGKSFIDLTCGFGIDAYFLSQNFEQVTLVEQNESLIKIVEHNWTVFDRKAKFINESLETFLSKNQSQFDVIYLDPARRDQQLKKKFLLEDLSPNLLEIQDVLNEVGKKIVVKLSPLIDISYLISVLKNITEIQIIAVKNDVKELLVVIEPQHSYKEIQCSCINLESNEAVFTFNIDDEKRSHASFGETSNYLYIPNNSILKSGAFNLISKAFNLTKLHPNTHFYTSEILVKNFPGRILNIEKIDAKQIEKNSKYNIISKNHPLSPDDIKKKYKIKDGGNQYLIFTQSQKGKIILRSLDA
ncbi:methyltransferase [Chryseobacterium sp. POL2]|uniref:THUMP-like domain-containing protein n=1 Tax=Chryseobacterium sp. POL2 TaxID=2713414 RepID=UPI0013E1CD9D|nr:RsmD family RNA methyltransferase [Chryseobacterium sp. POL2]QIG88805.1 methyltransferase [Chryseobacterium sp. POL2]